MKRFYIFLLALLLLVPYFCVKKAFAFAPAIVALAPEGLEAFYSIAAVLGAAVAGSAVGSAMPEDDAWAYSGTIYPTISVEGYNALSDSEKKSYVPFTNEFGNLVYIQLTEMSDEEIEFFNSVGATKSDDGFFDVFADGWNYISDFYSDLFSGADVSSSYNVGSEYSSYNGGTVTYNNAVSSISLTLDRWNEKDVVLAGFDSDHLICCYPYLQNNIFGYAFVSDVPFVAKLSLYYSDGSFRQNYNVNGTFKSYEPLKGYYVVYQTIFQFNGSLTVNDCSSQLLRVANIDELENVLEGLISSGDYGIYKKNSAEIGGLSFDLTPNSLAEYWATDVPTNVDDTWSYITGITSVNGSVVVDEEGTAIPVTGVAVPSAVSVGSAEDGVTVAPVDLTGVSPRVITKENTSETVADDSLDPTIETDTTTDLGILQGLWNWVTSFFTNLYKTLIKALSWLASAIIGTGTIDLSKFKISVGSLPTVFPFCVPFDMYNILALLNHTADAPAFTFDFNNTFLGDYCDFKISFDFAGYDELVVLFRAFVFLIFSVGLMRVTRDVIRG